MFMKKEMIYVGLFLIGLIASGIHPQDTFTWFLEVIPALIGLLILIASYRRFSFTQLSYVFILIHCYILFIGGHYTYAAVPLFDWIKEIAHQRRNNYDKVGHFAQGFVPALIIREVLMRQHIVAQKNWLPVIVVSMCISISVLYEFLEWFVAVRSGQSADAFLGTQGYVWDTQSDMLMACIGAISMLLLLSKAQDKAIQKHIVA
jgi:putative membrane protein